MNRRIKISSVNPDWNGTWTKQDIENEIADIYGNEYVHNYTWYEYLIDYVFDESEISYDVVKMFLEHDEIDKIYLTVHNTRVIMEK